MSQAGDIESDLKILILGEENSALSVLGESLGSLGSCLCSTMSDVSSMDQMADVNPDLAILSLSPDSISTMFSIHRLKIIDPAIPIFIASSDWTSADSFNCSFEDVYCLNMSLRPDEILNDIREKLRPDTGRDAGSDFQAIIGQSHDIHEVRKRLRRIADKDITVLITGETGTGKELIARAIHYYSHRSQSPMVKVDCTSLPEELLESEVFGFQRGAFTGAYKDKPGRLELADKGTLFIDEIGDLSLSHQVKFLQVLEDKAFSRLGGTDDKDVDVRVVAATNVDLRKMVTEGLFRKDLYYRLKVVHLEVPPLRERAEDIKLLARYFMDKYCYEFKREPLEMPDDVLNLFLNYHWPGNIRELENVIRRVIVVRAWDLVFEELHPEKMEVQNPSSDKDMSATPWSNDEIEKFFQSDDFSLKKISGAYVAEVESVAILKALQETGWNRAKAARLLKVSYKTLRNRIAELDLSP